ncbi:hypothetical protein [Brevibacterium sp.]|uniref:hypothetical protein n=1 Tax=Brevibacterium sp. TaxID=1701 RepID=UPI00281143C5|nr:hypothetical protein [Brevibacterium sp.]
MTSTAKPGDSCGGAKWIAVDFARLVRLPARLKCLWPAEMTPRSTSQAAAPARRKSVGDADSTAHEPASTPVLPIGLTTAVPTPQRSRDPDVLTAWLTGFAAELDFADARMTLVISSGTDAVHLEAMVHDHTALAILALRGVDFDEFSGFQLLRRLSLDELAPAVQELSALIDRDCVLTLTYLHACGPGGMEFLLRQDGRWLRPELERTGEGISANRQVDAGAEAIRTLFASVLTRLRFTSVQSPTAQPPAPAAAAHPPVGVRGART